MHTPYLAAEEKCNEVKYSFAFTHLEAHKLLMSSLPLFPTNKLLAQVGGYLADVLDADENNFIKTVLNVINPKVTLKIALKDY